MRRPAGVALLALAGLACPGGSAPPSSSPPTRAAADRPNVILLTIDTLRADHLGLHGYARATSPRLDAFAREAVVFQQAYTYWPKTRGSFVAMLTGRRDSQTGYGKTHPVLLDLNPTLASVLRDAGYATTAIVDNGNLARENGYAKGFDNYRETWLEADLASEMQRTRAITAGGVAYLRSAAREHPFFLWLHYVNPHTPYTPPPPYDSKFLDRAPSGPRLETVPGSHGGIPRRWAVAGQDRLAYYVAQYDGEIAAVDREIGEVLDAVRAAGLAERTLIVVTSDHGESLGEHGYYFDHGEDVFDPSLRVPLLIAAPEGERGARSDVLASTLDLVPTVLDVVKVSYPPELAGRSLLPQIRGSQPARSRRLTARNDRNLTALLDARYKMIATPREAGPLEYALYDRSDDPRESRDATRSQPRAAQELRSALEGFLRTHAREWSFTRTLLGSPAPSAPRNPQTCEALKALGYVGAGVDCR